MIDNILQLYSQVKAQLRSLLRNSDDIDDTVQEAFLKTLEAASKGSIANPGGYLYTTARNLALNKLTRNYYELFDFVEHFPDDISSLESRPLEQEVIGSEQLLLFCRVASQLPEQCRKVLILKKVYGYTQAEVAEELGLSVSTVEKHLIKAMVRCKEYMAMQEATFDMKASKWTQ